MTLPNEPANGSPSSTCDRWPPAWQRSVRIRRLPLPARRGAAFVGGGLPACRLRPARTAFSQARHRFSSGVSGVSGMEGIFFLPPGVWRCGVSPECARERTNFEKTRTGSDSATKCLSEPSDLCAPTSVESTSPRRSGLVTHAAGQAPLRNLPHRRFPTQRPPSPRPSTSR